MQFTSDIYIWKKKYSVILLHKFEGGGSPGKCILGRSQKTLHYRQQFFSQDLKKLKKYALSTF